MKKHFVSYSLGVLALLATACHSPTTHSATSADSTRVDTSGRKQVTGRLGASDIKHYSSSSDEIRMLIQKHHRKHLAGKDEKAVNLAERKQAKDEFELLPASNIPAEDLALLNKHASEVSGKGDTKISGIYACNSCCSQGKQGNLVETNHGQQCWECSGDACN